MELFETYGIDLVKLMQDASVNGNPELADVIGKQLKNVQTCYDVIAQKISSCPDTPAYAIDGEYVKSLLI